MVHVGCWMIHDNTRDKIKYWVLLYNYYLSYHKAPNDTYVRKRRISYFPSITEVLSQLFQWLCVILFSIYYNSGRCFLRALIDYLISEYPALFTDSPLVSPSVRRQTRVSCEQNAFPVFCRHKQKISQLINKLFPKHTKKVTKFGLEVLTGKALSFWLEFIDKTDEKVFCLHMQIKLKSCITIFSWLVHK